MIIGRCRSTVSVIEVKHWTRSKKTFLRSVYRKKISIYSTDTVSFMLKFFKKYSPLLSNSYGSSRSLACARGQKKRQCSVDLVLIRKSVLPGAIQFQWAIKRVVFKRSWLLKYCCMCFIDGHLVCNKLTNTLIYNPSMRAIIICNHLRQTNRLTSTLILILWSFWNLIIVQM